MGVRAAVALGLLVLGCGRLGYDSGVEGAVDPGDPLSMLSDDFAGDMLGPKWSVDRGAQADVGVAGGALVLEGQPGIDYWFLAQRAMHLWVPVTGDFVVTTHVRVTAKSDPTKSPPGALSFGGLIARDPGSDSTGLEDHVWIAHGALDPGVAGAEYKSTDDSGTVYDAFPWSSLEGTLRICRTGDDFHMISNEGPGFVEQKLYTRSDLGETLQVGVWIGSNSFDPDIRATFTEITFATPRTPADCTSP